MSLFEVVIRLVFKSRLSHLTRNQNSA